MKFSSQIKTKNEPDCLQVLKAKATVKKPLFLFSHLLLTMKLPRTRVSKKNEVHPISDTTLIQSHKGSIHSPQSIRNTMRNDLKKVLKFHLWKT